MSGMDRICKNCGKSFKSSPSQVKLGGGIYCSRKCYYESRSTPKVCIYCGETFYLGKKHRNNGINKFCSNKCHNLFMHDQQVEFTCEQCGIRFLDSASRNRKFCSEKCQNESRRREDYSPRIEKMCEICKKVFVVDHQNHRFCSKECSCFWLTCIRNKGENHPRYKGNAKKRYAYSYIFYKMRKEIIKEFMGKCLICGKEATPVHHVDYDKENNSKYNLVLLCRSCHAKTNTDRDIWKVRIWHLTGLF